MVDNDEGTRVEGRSLVHHSGFHLWKNQKGRPNSNLEKKHTEK
jgi:hypothetical protein